MQRNLTRYAWHTGKLAQPVRLLVISDLHNAKFDDLLPYCRRLMCCCCPGIW